MITIFFKKCINVKQTTHNSRIATLPQEPLINYLSCLISYFLYSMSSMKYFRLLLRIRLHLFRFSFSSSERVYLLSSLFTFGCLFVVSTSVDVVHVVEQELGSATVITIVGHFFPNDILIGYTTTKMKTTIHTEVNSIFKVLLSYRTVS